MILLSARSITDRLALACLLFILGVPAASAATYYVRPDGGDTSQCTGLADSPYPGSGTGQACAWNHPFMALPPAGTARIEGGDTLHIGSGDYRMGYGAPGADNCSQSWPWECVMPPIPSGPSPDQPTRILGEGHADGCDQAPELWGTERAWMVVNLEGSSNLELACLEITDRASCVEHHCHSGKCEGEIAACNRDSAPYGDWASTGISGRDSNNVVLRDLDIHGLSNRGVHAGRISDWLLERVEIRANGWAGWDGNIGSSTANSGTITFRESVVGWNGCIERWDTGEIFGCWAQQGGGWGDGIGTGATGGHWVFEDSTVHHNTSDGIDLLYLNDNGRVSIRRTLVEGNAGNQIKVSRSAIIENSLVVGNCSYFVNHPNMLDGDHCRAMGDAIYVGLSNSSQTDLINNTIVGEGNCLVSGGSGTSTSRLRMLNNLFLGKPYFQDPGKQSCLYYSGSNEEIVWESNYIDGVRHNACPGSSLCYGPPGITDDSLSSFDAHPLSDSALIDSADYTFAPPVDFHNLARDVGAGPDIGAIEWGTVKDDTPVDDSDGPPSDPPTAGFSYECNDLQCSFTSDSNDSTLSYAWNLGDGKAATGAVIDHTYGADGSYTVTLTVTDDNGQSSSASQTVNVQDSSSDDAGISIDATGYRTKGRWTADITWAGATTSNVDLFRNGRRVATIANSGSTTDHTDIRGGGTLEYRICEAGSSVCSEIVLVAF
ncbi:PKD domain-containing protein [Wenzhouxiangella sp. AB-CW3]|uniref:PKD domain-containing protein n=1 Tax=Wenzhouxiangella sp. AB-CW3 TaxID=2771012 RepID=UPI00168BEB34|nr:PKD domain-containing protein [Wenzhouxiangella sp. AB-CW3]QOC22043.1 PKD domain-containing protein [Wenzhouxiangella sp. AB-CW3]